MDTKFKIILVIFILVFIAYGVYFVIKDYNKEKSKYSSDKHLVEKYEDYDIRKQILNELDAYGIDNKTKTSIYDKLVADIDNLKNMSKDKLDDHIKDVVNAAKKATTKAPVTSTEASKESFEEDKTEETVVTEKFHMPREDKAPGNKSADKDDEKEIERLLDKTMSDLKQVKSMVGTMSKRINASTSAGNIIDTPSLKLNMKMDDGMKIKSLDKPQDKSQDKPQDKLNTKADKKDKKMELEKPKQRLGVSKGDETDDDSDDDADSDDKKDTIEGFENFSAKRFAFI